MSSHLSLVLRLFCFVFVFVFLCFHWIRDPSINRSSFFDMHAPRQPHAVTCQMSASFFLFLFLLFFISLEMSLFPSIFVPLPFPLCMERTSYVLPSLDGVFLPCDHGLDFLHHQLIMFICYHPIYSGRQTTPLSIICVRISRGHTGGRPQMSFFLHLPSAVLALTRPLFPT